MKILNQRKRDAMKAFKDEVMYIGAFVEGDLPKTERIIREELPNKNPEGKNHITLFFLGDYPIIEESLFDDIMGLPEGFTVCINGYGFDGVNQGVSVISETYDFQNEHLYGNKKAIPHITYSWDESVGGSPKGTGTLEFKEVHELMGKRITVKVNAYLFSGEMVPMLDYKERILAKMGENMMNQDKSGVLLLFLSAIRDGSPLMDYTDEQGVHYSGAQTYEAPGKYLKEKAKKDGSPIHKVVCITSRKAIDTHALEMLKNEWSSEEVLIKEIAYHEEYYTYHNEITQKNYDKAGSIEIFCELADTLGLSSNERVYIDYTGGLRDISFLMTTLIRFLEFRGIEMGTIVYSMLRKPEEGGCRIVDISYIYEVIRLINAVNEFLSTGNARELNTFSNRVLSGEGNRFSEIRELIKEITNFADAISICNISKIDTAIKSIVDRIQILENQFSKINNPEGIQNGKGYYEDAERVFYAFLFHSLLPTIKEKLFLEKMVSKDGEGRAVINYPWLVRWCNDNHLIQQAVTIYTERMPEYYVTTGYIEDPIDNFSDLGERFYKSFNSGFSDWKKNDEKQVTDRAKSESEWLLRFVVPCIKKNTDTQNGWIDFLNKNRKELLEKAPIEKENLCNKALDRMITIAKKYDKGDRIQVYNTPVILKNFSAFANSIPSQKSFMHYILYNNIDLFTLDKTVEVYLPKVMAIKKLEQEGLDNELIKINTNGICEIMRYYLMIKIFRNLLNHAGGHVIDASLLSAIRELAKKEGFVIGFAEERLTCFTDSTDIQNNLTVEGIQSVLNAAIFGECKDFGFRLKE